MQAVHRVGVFDADEEGSDDDMGCDLANLQGIK